MTIQFTIKKETGDIPFPDDPKRPEDLVKHNSPIHPGTGTDQSVHGGGGTYVAPPSDPQSSISTNFLGTDVSPQGFFSHAEPILDRFVNRYNQTGVGFEDARGRVYTVKNENEIWVRQEFENGGHSESRLLTKDRNGWFLHTTTGIPEGGYVGDQDWRVLAQKLGLNDTTLEGFVVTPASTETRFTLPTQVNQDRARKRLTTLDRLIERSNSELDRLHGLAPHIGDDTLDQIARVERDLVDYQMEHFQLNRFLDTPQLFEGEVPIKPKTGKVKPITSFSGRTGTIFDESPIEESRGINTDPHAIFEAELELEDGSTYRAVVDSVGTPGPGGVSVVGRILDENGDSIGKFDRLLNDNGNVHNSSFFMNRSSQGKGIGSLFWSHWEQELANAGFDTMTVSTADVGRYAWVVAGYSGGDVETWMEDLRENYVGGANAVNESDLTDWLDTKWGEAFGREVSGGEFVDNRGFLAQPAWSDYALDPEEMFNLATDPVALQEFALSNLNDYGEELGVKELKSVDWEDFDLEPETERGISDPEVLSRAQDLLEEYDSFGYVEPIEIAELGAGTSEHIGKRILLEGPGWEGEKDISWLRELEKALLGDYRRLWAEWATTKPIAVETDSPEWWSAVRELIDRQRKVRQIAKHASPVHPGTGTDQSVHGGGGSGPRQQQAIDTRLGQIEDALSDFEFEDDPDPIVEQRLLAEQKRLQDLRTLTPLPGMESFVDETLTELDEQLRRTEMREHVREHFGDSFYDDRDKERSIDDPDIKWRDPGDIDFEAGELPTTEQARSLIRDSSDVEGYWGAFEGAERVRIAAAEMTGTEAWEGVPVGMVSDVRLEVGWDPEESVSIYGPTITPGQIAYTFLYDMHHQEESGISEPLWRGFHADDLDPESIDVGDELEWGLASFSTDRTSAGAFGDTLFQLEEGAKVYPMDDSSFEQLAGGRFVVVSKELTGQVITIRQMGTFDPDTGKIEKRRSRARRIDKYLPGSLASISKAVRELIDRQRKVRQIAKHAKHNQKDHGNWARGLGGISVDGKEGEWETLTIGAGDTEGGHIAELHLNFNESPGQMVIAWIEVDPAHQRRGIAMNLIREAVRRHPDLHLNPGDTDPGAEGFDAALRREFDDIIPEYLKKALSPQFGNRRKRRAQLVARLKRRRRYGPPVKGGTGKQPNRNRGKHFN